MTRSSSVDCGEGAYFYTPLPVLLGEVMDRKEHPFQCLAESADAPALGNLVNWKSASAFPMFTWEK